MATSPVENNQTLLTRLFNDIVSLIRGFISSLYQFFARIFGWQDSVENSGLNSVEEISPSRNIDTNNLSGEIDVLRTISETITAVEENHSVEIGHVNPDGSQITDNNSDTHSEDDNYQSTPTGGSNYYCFLVNITSFFSLFVNTEQTLSQSPRITQ